MASTGREYYWLTDAGQKNALNVATDLKSRPELLPIARLLRAEYVPGTPIVFKPNIGRIAVDWTVGASVSMILVSARFIECLQRLGLTGWSTYPVTMYDTNAEALRGYSGLSITGRCGPILEEQRLSAIVKYPRGSSVMRRGLPFDESTRDGSDLFLPAGRWNVILATSRAAEELSKLGLSNLAVKPTSEFTTSI